MKRFFVLLIMTLVGTIFCSSHEGFMLTSEDRISEGKIRFPQTFIDAVNTGSYREAINQLSGLDMTYYADSIDKQIDFDRYDAFIRYIEMCPWIPTDVYYRICSYEAQALLANAKFYFYSNNDKETAYNLAYDALLMFLQIGELRVNKYLADSYCLMGNIYLENGDTLDARDAFYKSAMIYKRWNIVSSDYVYSLFYLALSMPKTGDYHNGNDCELAQIWDDCYNAIIKVKESNTVDVVLNESDILRYAIGSYVKCGLKHKWSYEFDEAEEAFLTAIERFNQRKKFTSKPIESLGNIEHYLLECRKLRLEVAHYEETDDIFQGDTTCELCTPYQLLVKVISNASHYYEIHDTEMCANCLYKAHELIEDIDSLPTNIKFLYHNLCLSVCKDSVVSSFLDEHDMKKSFNFLYQQYPTLIDSIRIKLTYAGSLVPYQMSSARAMLDSVAQLISINEKELIQSSFFPHLQLLYLITLINYDMAGNNQMLANPSVLLQDFQDNDAELRLIIAKDVALISSMWTELKTDSVFVENIDLQTQVPAMILMLSSFFSDDEQFCEKWAIDYLAWRKLYLSKYISIIPESKRDQWLDNDGLKAENAIFKHMDILTENDRHRSDSIVSALYNYELLRNEILFKSAQSMKQYLKDTVDVVASVLFEDMQQKKKRNIACRQQGKNDLLLMDSIAQAERVLSETTREYRTHKIFDESPIWDSIRISLRENEVAIEFVSYGEIDSYGAFVLRKTMSHPIWIPLKNPFFITQSIDELRPYFQKRAKGDIYGYYLMLTDSVKKKTNEFFYDAIWKPLTEYINEGDVVYYAPKGMLHYFPLQSIMDADSIYLMDKYNLNIVSSTGNLVEADRIPHTNNRIALYGGIYYDEASTNQVASNDRGRIGYLPYSKKEVLSISSLCRASGWECREYMGSDATEFSVKFLPEKDYSILHFATHNYYAFKGDSQSSTVLDRVGLCLYNANSTLLNPDLSTDSPNDGILTASEISVIDFENVTLVVLSACNTGRGDITLDGIAGLQRGFKMAGAKSIMMSLWPVDDAATYLLMTEFYRNYLDGKTKTESLRDAQRYLRNYEQDGEKIFADPKYWAAFVLLDALD